MKEYKGIDVSKWNGIVDFAKVKKSGIDFVMLRIGSGYGQKFCLDANFKTYYTNAKKNGLKIGCYFYSCARTPERATAEAKEVLNAIKGYSFDYPVCFDIEDKSQVNLSKQVITSICKNWLSTVEKAGYYAMIYSNLDWLKNRIDKSVTDKYDLWLAQWAKVKSRECGIWQYTDKGNVNGINGNVDRNISYKDYATIIKANGLNGFTKTPVFSRPVEPPKPATPSTPAKPTTKVYKKGDAVTLKNAKLYAASPDKTSKRTVSGTFYIYDGEKVFGRYRITNKKAFCGKKPTGLFVTGWVELK